MSNKRRMQSVIALCNDRRISRQRR